MNRAKDFSKIDGQMELVPTGNGELTIKEYRKPPEEKIIDPSAVCKLYGYWKTFLKKTGYLAQKYYLYEDLVSERPSQESGRILRQYYRGNLESLRQAKRRDEDELRKLLCEISRLQEECGLGPFSGGDTYLDRVIYRFVKIENRAHERKKFYRKEIDKQKRKQKPEPMSMAQLEAAFAEALS